MNYKYIQCEEGTSQYDNYDLNETNIVDAIYIPARMDIDKGIRILRLFQIREMILVSEELIQGNFPDIAMTKSRICLSSTRCLQSVH